jgi:hypothetical protein
MKEFHPVLQLLAMPGLRFKVHGSQPRLHVDDLGYATIVGSSAKAVYLYIRDFTSPTPTADGILAESGHPGCFAYLYHHVPDCPYFLYRSSPVQCTPQVTLELGVDLDTHVNTWIKYFGRETLTSWGIRLAIITKEVSAGERMLVLLSTYPYISLAISPRSSAPDLSIWPITLLEILPYIFSKKVCPCCRTSCGGTSWTSLYLMDGVTPASNKASGVTVLRANMALIVCKSC